MQIETLSVTRLTNGQHLNNGDSTPLAIKIIQNGAPDYLRYKLRETLFKARRKPSIGRFFNNTSGKIGKQLLQNKLQHMDRLNAEWLDRKWTNDLIRVMLKKTIFFFNNWPDSWFIFPLKFSYHELFLTKKVSYAFVPSSKAQMIRN